MLKFAVRHREMTKKTKDQLITVVKTFVKNVRRVIKDTSHLRITSTVILTFRSECTIENMYGWFEYKPKLKSK